MENLREYYERALREFGTKDSDLWMDYIKEELNHALGRPENCGQVYWRPENCGQVYWRAMRMLQGVSRAVYDSTCFVSSWPFVKRGRAQSPL